MAKPTDRHPSVSCSLPNSAIKSTRDGCLELMFKNTTRRIHSLKVRLGSGGLRALECSALRSKISSPRLTAIPLIGFLTSSPGSTLLPVHCLTVIRTEHTISMVESCDFSVLTDYKTNLHFHIQSFIHLARLPMFLSRNLHFQRSVSHK